ncbi:MAG TPA: isoprenylcysteine carboxylmethyltransferase family protein [Ferruginibacter sp.]|nr:isoprenylcysteine carboxylmethyltransferase family protein [Ferruginibacter sp.]
MITIGNFFFRYRNFLFIFLYLLLFIPSPQLFTERYFGAHYWYWPVVIGLIITFSGQAIRATAIGLAYIIRGGKNREIYAEDLVTGGLFNHCRNPLYLGNILMLFGVGVLSNSVIYIFIVMPFFIFIYHAIVLAEENFLSKKFGQSFTQYCNRVNRWLPSLHKISATFSSMHFNWKRWILKEYNTQFVWLSGITLILLFKYPQLTRYNTFLRNTISIIAISVFLVFYLLVRYLKKSKKLVE